MKNIYFYIIFFLLGMGTYLFIPSDYSVPNPEVSNQNTTKLIEFDESGNKCNLFQAIHAVGKNLLPAQTVLCEGK